MRRRRTLRDSFVVTVATTVGALSPGCFSDRTSADAALDADDATSGDATACPSFAPATGSPCAGAMVCGYSCATGGDGTARCVDGRWQSMVATCNPPPDVQLTDATSGDATGDAATGDATTGDATAGDATTGDAGDAATDASACPPTAPSGACTGTLTCGYGDCFGAHTTFATCTDGMWQVSVRSCNPPLDAGVAPDA